MTRQQRKDRGVLRDESTLQGRSVLSHGCTPESRASRTLRARMHCRLSHCLRAVWETLGPILWISFWCVTALRRVRPEICVRRQLNFNGICCTFSWFAARQFPAVPSSGRFARTQISFSPQRGRVYHPEHDRTSDQAPEGRGRHRSQQGHRCLIRQSLIRCLRRSTSSGKLDFLGDEFPVSSYTALCLVMRQPTAPLFARMPKLPALGVSDLFVHFYLVLNGYSNWADQAYW